MYRLRRTTIFAETALPVWFGSQHVLVIVPYSLKSGLLRMEIIRLLEERRHRQPQRSVRQAVLSSLEVVQSFALKHVLRGHRVWNLHDILTVFCSLMNSLGMCKYSHLQSWWKCGIDWVRWYNDQYLWYSFRYVSQLPPSQETYIDEVLFRWMSEECPNRTYEQYLLCQRYSQPWLQWSHFLCCGRTSDSHPRRSRHFQFITSAYRKSSSSLHDSWWVWPFHVMWRGWSDLSLWSQSVQPPCE